MQLTQAQIERYTKHIVLKNIGPHGQERICRGKVLIIGTGGLGSPAALYCAAAGIGTIGIVDHDRVELSNLQRQIIHRRHDLGKRKTQSAKRGIAAINDDIQVNLFHEKLSPDNADQMMEGYDFVLDCTDNFESKFTINDACSRCGIAFSHAGVFEFFGQAMTVLPGKSACYRCVFQAPPPAETLPSSSQSGVFAPIAGIFGTIQAGEAIKFLAGTSGLLLDVLLTFDVLSMDFHKVKLRRRRQCPSCGEKRRHG